MQQPARVPVAARLRNSNLRGTIYCTVQTLRIRAGRQTMERTLSADLERASSSMSCGEANYLNIQLLTNDSSLGDAHIWVPAEGQIALGP